MAKVRIGIDAGVGHIKVVSDVGNMKFPTMLAYFSKTGFNETESVEFEGQKYTIGEDAIFERQKISISSASDIIKYYPVFQKYILEKLNVRREDAIIVTGIPPSHKHYRKNLLQYCDAVLPQGIGIYVDVSDSISGKSALILDIGYSTVDYILVVDGKKKKGDTFEKQGVERMIEIFRSTLPVEKEFEAIRQYQFHRLMSAFLEGSIKMKGVEIDLKPYRDQAIKSYKTVLMSRLNEEIDYLLDEVDQVVVAGGGAYYLSDIRQHGLLIPDEPEMSQARGYFKSIIGEEQPITQKNNAIVQAESVISS
ncbi:MAG TPA: ParM/StbA family protein [Thermodesulfobium narugense]|nr:ParM/StbA family protein [Thermodesulfobium narugense]